MFDLKRTHASTTLTRPIATGTMVEQEGLMMCAVLEGGVEKVSVVAAPAGTEKVIGFSKTADSMPGRTSGVEEITVPAAGTLEVDLRAHNLVVNNVRVVIVSSGVALTPDFLNYANPTADNTVKINAVSGKLKFHADEAGVKVLVTYLYDLTINEAKIKFGERHINNRGVHLSFGVVEVGSGVVEVWTDQFDASADWTSGAVRLGPNGTVVKAAPGPVLNLTVINVPSAEIPFLGLRGSLGL